MVSEINKIRETVDVFAVAFLCDHCGFEYPATRLEVIHTNGITIAQSPDDNNIAANLYSTLQCPICGASLEMFFIKLGKEEREIAANHLEIQEDIDLTQL